MGIHEPKVYAGLDEMAIYERVSRHGHTAQRVVEEPGVLREVNKSDCDLVLAFVAGSADVRIGAEVFHVVSGDKLNIPGGRPHSTLVGEYGVLYYVTQVEGCTD